MKKPSIKEMLIPFINEQRTGIRFGGHQMNIARDIEVDNVELFYEFIKLLNGKNSLKRISELIKLPEDVVTDICADLQEAGVLYENNVKEFEFTEEEINYYNRNINFFAWIDTLGLYYNYWEVQFKLKQAKVLLLGAGGTGSHCAESLARMGIGNITLVDFDKIELSNLNRQNFTKNDINKEKAIVLNSYLNNINPFINIKSIHKEIVNQNDLDMLVGDNDIIISCIDKPKNIHDLLDITSKKHDKPWILGGYASTIMNHALFKAPDEGLSSLINKDIAESYDAKMISLNDEWSWENAIISPIANISGNISALYALYYLTDLVQIQSGKIQHIDFFNIQKLEDFSYMTGE
ncbi:ThiF family adenylyltransferase [Listeria innocua]|uniref:HesA/MoeB/ThiF family protein n=1 Tax=Listeria TaxID=1637 RepID=UPI000F26D81A|nr:MULTISPECIES: ThiF family adenylyltransferase [Listeria]EKF1960082.1 ThiF family adenylyltransferase [Listeria monocytogenes]EAD5868710.1 ThiF family adenylyltransferase [Listeria innocua]EAF5677000.1 ThiF family adenylyltransferase [Listeria innocua]EHF3600202.1 ThiF family adenylyltransferase [Listeria innocua]EHF3615158.1 ThiF family adenylyltransferase [Listeria innocua]